MFRTIKPLILASASPRRRALLYSLGLEFGIHPATGLEPDFRPGSDPMEFAVLAARGKAGEVWRALPETAVLAADTIVVVDGDVLGKPGDGAEAVAMLARLAGREHEVITGCCLRLPAGREEVFAARTRVWMGDFGRPALSAYAATNEPLDKAGAYGIQERAAFLVERIQGSYTNVVGLPLAETVKALLAAELIAPEDVSLFETGQAESILLSL